MLQLKIKIQPLAVFESSLKHTNLENSNDEILKVIQVIKTETAEAIVM